MSRKIVFFVGTLLEGGAERVISILSNYLVREGSTVDIILYYDREPFYEIDKKVNVTFIERETGTKNIVRNLFWFHRYLRTNDSVLISFLAPFNMFAIVANLFTGNNIIVADRNDPDRVPKNWLLRKTRNLLYYLSDGVVVQTEKNLRYFSKYIQNKSRIIFNPVNLGVLSGKALSVTKRKRIVSVGRLMLQKKQQMLINAFLKIHSKYPGYDLTIYGEGPERNNLQNLIEKKYAQEFIHLPGSKKNVHECILDAELFVLSSEYEGMPNALAEAMCLGLPVISTKVSGATDLIKNYCNGLLVDVNDTDGLVLAMDRMLANKNLRDTCGNNAVKVNDMLDKDLIVGQWLDLIEKI